MASNEYDYSVDPFTFELDKLFVIPLYFLSFVFGIPLNGYIINRLYVRGVKGSYYYKLLMLMSVIDIYIAFFYAVEYYNAGTYTRGSAQITIINFLNAIQTFFTLIVIVHWKTVIKKNKRLDKMLYSMSATHFIVISIILIYAFAEFYILNDYNYNLLLLQGWIIGIATIIVFFVTTFVCVYSIAIVLFAETDSYSVQTLKAYKRMAVAHFVQCILAEIDIIAQNFMLGVLFTAVSATVLFYSDSGEINYEQIPGWMHFILKANVVFLTLNYLIPVIKPFIRSTFIAWALRRLLSEEKTVVTRVHPASTIRSTTKDN